MSNITGRLVSKTDKQNRTAFAVTYTTDAGKEVCTQWTTYRDEACIWGQIISQHGYCMSAKEFPRLDGKGHPLIGHVDQA